MKAFLKTEDLYKLYLNSSQKITTDTRKIEPGSIFFALKGKNFDANKFAINAINEGCSYAIVDDVSLFNGSTIFVVENVLSALQNLAKFHRQQLKIPFIGITGSNGKTTHKELIYAVLSKKFNAFATNGNLNNHIGVPLSILQINKKHEIAIIEMGANHQGEIALLSSICNPDFGLITNIGKAHLEGFGGEEGIRKGKGELYQHLKSKNGKIFINGNDKILLELSGEVEKIYYGENETFDVYGQLIKNSEFVEFKWVQKSKSLKNRPLIKTHLFGHYNFINVLCAACIGNYFEVEDHLINEALNEYIPDMNRSQVKVTKNNSLILDAYNANPTSISLAIEHFVKQPFKNKTIILGDMFELGIYSENEHKNILNKLKKIKEVKLILIGENFHALKDHYSDFLFFKKIEDAETHLHNHKILNGYILIKGSRAIHLEKLVDFL
ncbi:MAG: UDP-N-acetylmuramoyl-tripeptide--D-alanyl-D-alanine ligase [Bacteroidota bacterium]